MASNCAQVTCGNARLCIAGVVAVVIASTSGAVYAENSGAPASVNRQALDDAWWTGPILAAGAGTLPQGHALIEPYLYDAIRYGRFNQHGTRQSADRVHGYGSLTYLLYGVTDKFTVGLIPVLGFNDVSEGRDSSGVRVGDITLQAQYRLSQFREGRSLPTTSLVIQQSFPTGSYDRLGENLNDAMGSGAYTTTVALYSQYYFWMRNGRILRTRFNVAGAYSDDVRVDDASVYGTAAGFRGVAKPGSVLTVNSAWEYSITRNWVFALDFVYQHDDNTRLRGFDTSNGNAAPLTEDFGSAWRFGVAPAIEYNWTSEVGVIVGARWFGAGRNTSATITPVVALNMVF